MRLGRWIAAVAVAWPAIASAGSGPWTLGQDDRSVYVGLDHSRWTKFPGGEGSLSDAPLVEFGSAVTRTDLHVIASYGLLSNTELEVDAGVAMSSVSRDDGPICAALGGDACEDTTTITPVAARLKVRVLDELGGAPLSLSFGPMFRFGDYIRPVRGRVTNIGEGQTDVGAFLVGGRSGGLGGMGSYGVYLDVGYRYRLPIQTVDGLKTPGDELTAVGEVLVYPASALAVGLTVDLLHRGEGVDFEEANLADVDRFSSLSITQVKAGGKLILRNIDNVSFVAQGLYSVYSRNNPIDAVTIGVGVGTYRPSPKRVAAP